MSAAPGSGSTQQLGKKDLGRHAYEQQMPQRLSAQLAAEDASNKLDNIIPLLRQLLVTQESVLRAYLCDDSVVQVWKLSGEDKTVLQIQDLIEEAWGAGHNAEGRQETGGVAGTRKHIGSLEVDALLSFFGMPSSAHVFTGKSASQDLLSWVEKYFHSGAGEESEHKTITTNLSPLYLQMPFHSITIVGCVRTSSSTKLLVLDPGVEAPASIRDASKETWAPTLWQRRKCLWAYQRGPWYLKRHRRFEVLQLLPE